MIRCSSRAGAETGGRVAEEGAQIAREAGLQAESVAIEAIPPVWKRSSTPLISTTRRQSLWVLAGLRLRSMLLGSVSNAVVHHAGRPTLVIHRSGDDAGRAGWEAQPASEAKPPTIAP